MIEIDPHFGKAEADEARISTALLLRTGYPVETVETILSIVTKRVWPGHCRYRGQ